MIAMQLGAVTYNVLKDMDLETVIKTLETTGFEGVELRTTHKHGVEPSINEAERARVKERFARSKVKLLSYGTTCEFHATDPAERRKQIDLGKQFVTVAHDTDARGVKVRPNGLPNGVPKETTIANIARGAARTRRLRRGVRRRDLARSARRADAGAVGVCRDHARDQASQRRPVLELQPPPTWRTGR